MIHAAMGDLSRTFYVDVLGKSEERKVTIMSTFSSSLLNNMNACEKILEGTSLSSDKEDEEDTCRKEIVITNCKKG